MQPTVSSEEEITGISQEDTPILIELHKDHRNYKLRREKTNFRSKNLQSAWNPTEQLKAYPIQIKRKQAKIAITCNLPPFPPNSIRASNLHSRTFKSSTICLTAAGTGDTGPHLRHSSTVMIPSSQPLGSVDTEVIANLRPRAPSLRQRNSRDGAKSSADAPAR